MRKASTRAAPSDPVPGNGRAWEDWGAGLRSEDNSLEVTVVPTARASWPIRHRTRGGPAIAF